MHRSWLEEQFARGRSLEQIGRTTGMHPSTVGYWARKHGLRPPGATRFAARGAPDRALVERLASEGASLRAMADELDRSVATVRHWLKRWGIERADGRRRALPPGAPQETVRDCARHGSGIFRLDARRTYRCARCSSDAVSARRRKVKQILVEEAGGRCALCGYDRCVAALHFHHLDPRTKRFAVSNQGITRSLAEVRTEAGKCLLLCANCHAEVEAGFREPEAA